MGTALERLKKSVSMQPQRKSVELPDGDDFEFFMTPLTLAQRAKAQKQAKSDDATDFALQLLAMKATDASGIKLFQSGELAELRNELPASVVDALMLQMLSEDESNNDEEEEDPKLSSGSSRKKIS